MSSLSVALPLSIDATNGFAMNTSLAALVKQNLKMLILTNPGERVMEPNFGAGIQTILFSSFSEGVQSIIETTIREQCDRYMPIISISEVQFYILDPDANTAAFRIIYTIPNLGVQDLLEFTI
tara:strand:+ start:158 stop:526 length:369 start_codon:yes stop_codon:yes gene_type:complete